MMSLYNAQHLSSLVTLEGRERNPVYSDRFIKRTWTLLLSSEWRTQPLCHSLSLPHAIYFPGSNCSWVMDHLFLHYHGRVFVCRYSFHAKSFSSKNEAMRWTCVWEGLGRGKPWRLIEVGWILYKLFSRHMKKNFTPGMFSDAHLNISGAVRMRDSIVACRLARATRRLTMPPIPSLSSPSLLK